MSAFTDKTDEISRIPVQLAVVTVDKCALTFGVGACEATLSDKSPEELSNNFFDYWTAGAPDDWAVLFTPDANNFIAENPDGGLMLTSDNSLAIYLRVSSPSIDVMEAGKTYRYAVDIEDIGAPGDTARMAQNAPFSLIQEWSTAGLKTGTFVAVGTQIWFGNSLAGTCTSTKIRSISIREEVPGAECYNTFFTCLDKINFDRTTVDRKFTTYEAPAPFSGARPYIKSITELPTRISKSLTVKGRRKIKMVDEESDDINIDPYFATRTSVQGEFWKKFVARNPNYHGRQVKIYDGYLGLTEAEFEQRWTGTIENITIRRGDVTLSCVDNLDELQKFKAPDDIKAKTLNVTTDAQDTIVLDTLLKADGTQIESSGYVQLDTEIIYYDALNIPANTLIDCTRGVLETDAVEHKAKVKVVLVKYYPPDNPFDILQTILNDSGIDNADIDTTAWAYWKDWPKTDVDYSGIVLSGEGLTSDTIFWEIVNLLDCNVWQNEEQKITIRRNISNEPGRLYTDITDDANIIDKSGSADYNDQYRRTRIVIHWGKDPLTKIDDPSGYSEVDIAVNVDYESANGYGGKKEEVIFCRWVSKRFLQEEVANRYMANIVRRKLLQRLDASPIIKASMEIKDEGILTGDNVVLTSDEVLQIDGSPVSENYLVTSRSKVNGRLTFQLLRTPKQRICFIAPNGINDYNSATDAQREYGFISNSEGTMPNGDPGYLIY